CRHSTGGTKGDLTAFQRAKVLPNIKLKIEPGFSENLHFAFCNFHFSMKCSVPFQYAKLIPGPL
ncbi:MAG: hypothetical protein NTV04_05870, partial [Deltaproteobacteria bacterium]|nr:hypothetical protein [Deltaproteobacteria bacterium]